LRQAIREDSAMRPARIPFNWGNYDGLRTNRTFRGVRFEQYYSDASGRVELRWLGERQLYNSLPLQLDRPGIELVRPAAYWVPVTSPDVIDRLRSHGIRMEQLEAPRAVRLQMMRLVEPRPFGGAKDQGFASAGGSSLFEARYRLETGARAEVRTETYPAGSVRVPTDQPLGDLAVAMLEPESHDSLFAWGFFPEILEQPEYIEAYVAAPMAERMLARDAALKGQFEEKLRTDPKFAANPDARLEWFYERSRFYDDRYMLYPVGIESATAEIETAPPGSKNQ
jgi:hypothetical protein